MAQYGTVAFAAYGIGMSLVSFTIVIGFGFGIATATLAGQQLGAGDRDAAARVVGRALGMAILIMATLSAVVAWAAEDLALFMIDDPEVTALTVAFIYFIAVGQPIMAIEFTLGGAFRGAGDTRFPLVATFCGIIFRSAAARPPFPAAGALHLLDLLGDADGLLGQGRVAALPVSHQKVAGRQNRARSHTRLNEFRRQRQKKYLKFEIVIRR